MSVVPYVVSVGVHGALGDVGVSMVCSVDSDVVSTIVVG